VYAQNVGIGTDTPTQKLHVVGGARVTALGGSGNALVLSDNTGVLSVTALSGNPTDVFTGTGVFAPISSLDNDWQVTGNDMYSIPTGNVGVGIAAPAYKFHVAAASGGTAVGYFDQNSTAAGSHAVKGEGAFGPTRGYLGVQGGNAFDGTSWNFPGLEIGVVGISEGGSSTDNRGLMGLSNGIGVYGESTINNGMWGQTASATNYGVRGFNTNATGTGVYGSGNNIFGTYLIGGSGGAFTGFETGVFALADGALDGTGLIGVSNGAPITTLVTGSGVSGSSDLYGVTGWSSSTALVTRAGGYFDTGGGQSYAYVGMRTNFGTIRKIEGNGTVNTTVKDTKGDLVVLSCPEAPENLFQDYGQGKLVNGKAHIDLDPILTKNIVVDETHPLRVFVQLEGDCMGVYVTNKSASGFDVIELAGGNSNVDFSWTVTANRADEVLEDGTIARYSSERFAPAQGPRTRVVKENGVVAQPSEPGSESEEKE